jgi:hypothetical protein
MAGTYYKYVERDADSQVNYAEVGQQAVDMLQNWNQTREDKKEAYKQASRESINNLMDAPQGQDQDANNFISNYSQDMINQKMIDKNLFERGLINEKDYTLRMQNQMDGTKRLFALQKLYQDNFATTMQDINDKKIQRALTTFNQSSVEGAANFNASRAFVNPDDGTVSVGLMENKVIDGKVVKVLNKNTAASTAVWTGKILQKPIYFDVNSKTTDFVKNLGDLKTAVYSAASTARAGTITELTGAEFLKTNIKDPATKAIVENFNDAVNLEVDSYFASNPLNVISILGDETGKYNEKSFTFDKEEADADSKKILLKIDPVSKMSTLDDTGKNYEAQLQEAKAFAKTQILGKLDNEKKISATAQLDESAYTRERAARINRPPTPGEAPPPAATIGELILVRTYDKKGVGKITGVAQSISDLIIDEAKGIQNVFTAIGYNHTTGALELKGYQAVGKQEQGTKTTGEGGDLVGTAGSTVVKRTNFLKSSLTDAGLITTTITKIPNPERPGYNFSNMTEAKDYFRRQYEIQTGKKELD